MHLEISKCRIFVVRGKGAAPLQPGSKLGFKVAGHFRKGACQKKLMLPQRPKSKGPPDCIKLSKRVIFCLSKMEVTCQNDGMTGHC